MKRSTANAIRTIINCDETATDEERASVRRAVAKSSGTNGEVSVAEASSKFGLSRTTVWRMCKNGAISCQRRGKKYFISPKTIKEMAK